MLISMGMTSFLLVAASGASAVISASAQNAPQIENNAKSFYSATGAVELALYEASARGAGFQTSGFLDSKNINKSSVSWNVESRTGMEKITTSCDPSNPVAYIPPRLENDTDGYGTTTSFIASNWRKVRFGESVSLDLFVDNAAELDGATRLEFGGSQSIPERESSCETFLNYFGLASKDDIRATAKIFCEHYPAFLYAGNSCLNEFSSSADECLFNIKYNFCYSDIDCPNGYLSTSSTSPPPDPDEIEQKIAEGSSGILGKDENGNNYLEDIFFELYIPKEIDSHAEEPQKPLLSWKLEGKTSIDDLTLPNSSIPNVLSISRRNTCEDQHGSAGSICINHQTTHTSPFLNARGGSFGEGILFSLTNPIGLVRGKNSIIEGSIMDFAQKQIGISGETTESFSNFPFYFPRLTLQLGPPQKTQSNVANGTDSKSIPFAYARVGFQFSDCNQIQNFPVPDDTVKISATGAAGNLSHKLEAEIIPSEIAPMFNFAVLQH